MDIQTEKLNLIQWLTTITEPAVIEKFASLKKNQETDWWDDTSNNDKYKVEGGSMQANRGKPWKVTK